jgi:tetratricopeptide (TPR) repeat protein
VAIRRLETSLAANPNNPAAYMTLGHLHVRSGNYTKAREVWAKAAASYPSMWIAANNLAFLISEYPESPTDLEQAKEYAERAFKLNPENPLVLDTLGWIYYKKADLIRASDYMQKALAKAPESPVVNYHMGMVLYKSGQPAEALERLEKALAGNEEFHGRPEAEAALKMIQAEG